MAQTESARASSASRVFPVPDPTRRPTHSSSCEALLLSGFIFDEYQHKLAGQVAEPVAAASPAPALTYTGMYTGTMLEDLFAIVEKVDAKTKAAKCVSA